MPAFFVDKLLLIISQLFNPEGKKNKHIFTVIVNRFFFLGGYWFED